MDNKTIRWITNLLLCVGTGFMVTGASILAVGELDKAGNIVNGATMLVCSAFVVALSYLVAMQEVE